MISHEAIPKQNLHEAIPNNTFLKQSGHRVIMLLLLHEAISKQNPHEAIPKPTPS
jgi:hypothetical protein